MQTLHQVVEGLVKTSTHDHVILTMTNAGGSSRVRALSEIFDEDQIDALEESAIICEQRELPDLIRTPEDLRHFLDMSGSTMLTFHWTTIRTDGSTVEYDVDDSRVF